MSDPRQVYLPMLGLFERSRLVNVVHTDRLLAMAEAPKSEIMFAARPTEVSDLRVGGCSRSSAQIRKEMTAWCHSMCTNTGANKACMPPNA